VLLHLGGPPDFQAVQLILSASVFDGKLRVGRVLPLVTRLVTVDAEGTVRSK
jgi:hypothetical protein